MSAKFLFAAFVASSAMSLWAQAPGLTGRKLDFGRDIHPVLNERCAGCHSAAVKQGGLSLSTVADLKKGGVSGPAIVPGNGKESVLIARLTGEKGPVMPMGGKPLSEREIAVIRDWIDRGAQADLTPSKPTWTSQLGPRHPEVPAGGGHPVDAFLQAYWKQKNVSAPGKVSDELFVRRAYLDLHGLPPTAEQRERFLLGKSANKRTELIDLLLSERKRYAEHWVSFWNDMLHNDEGVIYHGERKSISKWLLKALEEDMPYDRFVATLLNPAQKEDPEGFLVGVNWRGDISASQMPAMQAAQNTAQVFLGVNIKCASCHDSFINNWKLADAYGLASFFAEKPLEIVRCDVKTGKTAEVSFLYPELGKVAPETTSGERRAAAARMFTSPANGRLARTFVNRMWQRLVGRGFVEPADDMDAEPWNADLLDWLAADFTDHKYDVDHLIRQIMTSSGYQAPSVGADPDGTAFVFRGPAVRRLTAEEFSDSVASITGEWRTSLPTKAEPAGYVRDWRLKASPLSRAMGRPVRDLAVTDRADDPSTLQALELVNGATLAALLERGAQRLTGQVKPAPSPVFDSGVNGDKVTSIDLDISGLGDLYLLAADSGSYDPTRVVAGWANATVEGPSGSVPLTTLLKEQAQDLAFKKQPAQPALMAKLGQPVHLDLRGKGFTRLRASAGVDEKSQNSEINPRVRFLAYSAEPDFHQLILVEGATPVVQPAIGQTPDEMVKVLFERAWGRLPAPAEMEKAKAVVTAGGPKLAAEGVEDLLWILVMSPEFQFIL